MSHGGDIYEKNIVYDFSVSINPMGIHPEVFDAIKASLGHIREYPDIMQRRFKETVSAVEGCEAGNVLGGNGASELFLSIVQAVRPETALIVSPCFSGYEYALNTISGCNIDYCTESDLEVLPDRINSDTGMVFIANPNNPSGRNINTDLLKNTAEKCEETGTWLIIDECFLLLSEHQYSLSPFAVQNRNCFVVKAFTKSFAIPGVRTGYVISSVENISKLASFVPEWNLSVPATEAGIACAKVMEGSDYLKRSFDLVKKERGYLERGLTELGFKVIPSDTCYILFWGKEGLSEKLLDRNILIRDCSDFRGLEKGWYRISVKEHEANRSLINSIKDIAGINQKGD